MSRKREKFAAVVTEVQQRNLLWEIYLRDAALPAGLGPEAGEVVAFVYNLQGHYRNKPPSAMTAFGRQGLVKGSEVWCYHKPGDRQQVTYVCPRI